jgi:myb proto-oncogene protein
MESLSSSNASYSTSESAPSSRKCTNIAHDAETVRTMGPRSLQNNPNFRSTWSRSSNGLVWTSEQDEVLRAGVLRHGSDDWKVISDHVATCGSFSQADCKLRWAEIKELPVKGPWSPDEDGLLCDLVARFGPKPKKWSYIATQIPGRAGKQCRERWLNHLDLSVKKGEWTFEEDRILCQAQREVGNKWSEIAKLLPGRSVLVILHHMYFCVARVFSRARNAGPGRQ